MASVYENSSLENLFESKETGSLFKKHTATKIKNDRKRTRNLTIMMSVCEHFIQWQDALKM